MVQELRGRDVARERQARGSFRKMMGSPVGTKKKKGVYWLTRMTVCELTEGISSPTLRSAMSH